MAARARLVADIQRLMATLGAASAATGPTPWLNVDLSMPQLKALMVLHHRGIVRVGEVAHTLGMSANATTAVLDRLEDEGLARRQVDLSDRRAVLVGLTEAGTHWITELLSASARDFGEVLDQLSVADLEALHQGMTALSHVLPGSEASNGSDFRVTTDAIRGAALPRRSVTHNQHALPRARETSSHEIE